MKILLAPDKFRGSLSAAEVCRAMTEGIRQADPSAEAVALPLADGGEGTLDILLAHAGGRKVPARVEDPLGRPIQAEFGLSADGQTAYVETAAAAGLRLLQPHEYDALRTSTYGLGQLLTAALDAGAQRVVLGLGGSATTDGGTGMAAALGYRFRNADGREIARPCGGTLGEIARIDSSRIRYDFSNIQIDVACDVTNPLTGPAGTAAVYAPQKGATAEDVAVLEVGLRRLAELTRAAPLSLGRGAGGEGLPGDGAAGGLGFGTRVFLNATLKPGVELVMDHVGFDEALDGVDLILTGEGKLDGQTLAGKLIAGICRKAGERGIPVAALVGTLDADPVALRALGLSFATSVLTRPQSLDEALETAFAAVRDSAFWTLNLFFQSSVSSRQSSVKSS
jgi:glycerate kinase